MGGWRAVLGKLKSSWRQLEGGLGRLRQLEGGCRAVGLAAKYYQHLLKVKVKSATLYANRPFDTDE